MKKLILLGTMLAWSAAASAQDGDQCPASSLPNVSQTNVATVERNADTGSAVIQLDVAASDPNGGALAYVFSSADGVITGDGSRGTWTVSGAGPFTADVAVTSAASGCTAHARFTYHMEQSPSE